MILYRSLFGKAPVYHIHAYGNHRLEVFITPLLQGNLVDIFQGKGKVRKFHFWCETISMFFIKCAIFT